MFPSLSKRSNWSYCVRATNLINVKANGTVVNKVDIRADFLLSVANGRVKAKRDVNSCLSQEYLKLDTRKKNDKSSECSGRINRQRDRKREI